MPDQKTISTPKTTKEQQTSNTTTRCRSQPTESENDKCKVCNVKVKDRGIRCDACETWHHIKCLKMKEDTYKLYANENLQWVCQACINIRREENNLLEIVREMKQMAETERERNMEERMKIMQMMQKMSGQVTELENKVENMVNEKIKKVEDNILGKVNNEIDEKLEKFKRRKNLVVYGLPESNGRNDKERNEEDMNSIKNMIEELEIEVENFETTRLGSQIKTNKPRPLKIELRKEVDKSKILRKAANLRNAREEKFKKVILSPDMTLKMRELDKILRDELKMRRQAGERNIKIKDGKIVKIGGDAGNQG